MTEPDAPKTKPAMDWSTLIYVTVMLMFSLGSLACLICYIWTHNSRWGWTAALLGVVGFLTSQVEDDD